MKTNLMRLAVWRVRAGTCHTVRPVLAPDARSAASQAPSFPGRSLPADIPQAKPPVAVEAPVPAHMLEKLAACGFVESLSRAQGAAVMAGHDTVDQ